MYMLSLIIFNMQGRKSTDESQLTSDEENETPTKIVRSERSFSQRKQNISVQEQMDIINERIFKLQLKIQSQKRDEVIRLLLFLVFLVMGYIFILASKDGEIKLIKNQILQLQSKQLEWKKQAAYLQKIMISMRQELDTLHRYTQKLANQIIDIHLNQLARPEKSYNFLFKYSTPFPFLFDKSDRQFKKHYKKVGGSSNKIKKISHEEVIFHSEESMSGKQIWYFQIKIEQSQLGMIAIGVFTQSKNTSCGYCESDKMYYIYCQNGKIYHGQSFEYIKYSLSSRFAKVSKGDIVTVFIDNEGHEIIWYVNKKYAGAQYLEQTNQQENLHPFVLMTSRGDEIQILTQ